MINEIAEPNQDSIFNISYKFSKFEVRKFTISTKDSNPVHINSNFAKKIGFKNSVVPGAMVISKVASLLSNEYSRLGVVIGDFNWVFRNPIFVNQTVNFYFKEVESKGKRVVFYVGVCSNNKLLQNGTTTVFFKL